jgi:hypothetical protein
VAIPPQVRFGVVPPEEIIGQVPVTAERPPSPAAERHDPLIAKHPVWILSPLPKVEVAVAEILIVSFPVLPRERSVPGVVVPMPTFPLVARKSEEVEVRVLVPLKYGNCPVVPA